MCIRDRKEIVIFSCCAGEVGAVKGLLEAGGAGVTLFLVQERPESSGKKAGPPGPGEEGGPAPPLEMCIRDSPSLELLVITPICPHSLNNRSVIVTAGEQIRMRVDSRQSRVVLTADGQVGFDLEDGDSVAVKKADRKVKLIHFGDNSFYRLLRQKLKD